MAANLPKVSPSRVLQVVSGSAKALKEFKKVDPRDRFVLLYPNSTSARVGMGLNLLNNPKAEEVFDDTNKLLDRNILKLCLDGPKSELLNSLVNRSLATYVISHAAMKKLEYERGSIIPLCKAAGGIGVGFVNSLVFSGAMTYEDGLDLVQKQAQAMEKAASIIPNAKILIHIKPATRKRKMCQAAIEHCLKIGISPEVAICSVTRQTHAHIIEVGGHEEAIRYLENEGHHLFGFRRMKRVVSIPQAYHTDLMQPAKEFLSIYLKKKLEQNPNYLRDPSTCSVYSATAGHRLRSVKEIKKDLISFPTQSIKIEQLLHCLFDRPEKLAQPNILVLGDGHLIRTLSMVNRKAFESAKLLKV